MAGPEWFFKLPSDTQVQHFLQQQEGRPFSYSEQGATKGTLPAGYAIAHHRSPLGSGPLIYERAVRAIKNWVPFQISWIRLYPNRVPIEPGRSVGVIVRCPGMWAVNIARIIHIIEEDDQFGFAYGTLAAHAEIGEERFLVEKKGDAVWYDISSFSRHGSLLAKLASPYIRYLQRKFALESIMAMAGSV